jgi:hypothetical protein
MADIRLYQFPEKPAPTPQDIIYAGNTANAFEEVQITIAELIAAYPNLESLALNPTISPLALTLLSNTTTTQMQSTLGLVIGTNIQAYSAALTSIAGLTTSAYSMIYTTAADTYAAISTVANSVLGTNGSGVPSFSTSLPAGISLVTPTTLGVQQQNLDMNGFKIVNLLDPTNPQDAATKSYVDSSAGGGFTVILSCAAATTANLNATPAGAGVGATLTNAGAMAAFSVDGYSASLNDRILVKNQTLSQHNGVYILTTVGSGAVNWVLSRATDYDTNTEIIPGTLVAVNNGTINGTTSWLQTATVTVVDTDPVVFSQFTFAPSSFFLIANNLSEGNPTTMRNNLGLGDVAVKTASDNSKTFAVMLNAAPTIGHLAIFTDTNGTIGDGGLPTGVNPNSLCDGRLTLTTGVPVTTSNVTAATNVYFTPYKGEYISLYNGATWDVLTFTELAIAVPGTTNTIYDVFCYNNSGTPTLELAAWTNDTTRSTAIVFQDGVYVKSGDATRRYLGSFRTTGVSGQTEDSTSNRFLWNYYNRVHRAMRAVDATASWTYSVNAYRQARASTANQLNFIVGVAEDMVSAFVMAMASNSTTAFNSVLVGIGLDSTSANSAQTLIIGQCNSATGNAFPQAMYEDIVPAGRHFLAWLERGAGANVQTWTGTGGNMVSGIQGEIWS